MRIKDSLEQGKTESAQDIFIIQVLLLEQERNEPNGYVLGFSQRDSQYANNGFGVGVRAYFTVRRARETALEDGGSTYEQPQEALLAEKPSRVGL